MEVVEIVPDKSTLGRQFRKDAKPLMDWFNQLDRARIEDLEGQLREGRSVWNVGHL